MNKKFFVVLDVEGTGNPGTQQPYDFGWAVMDREGNIVEEFSYLNVDTMSDCRRMATAYYVNKLPEYYYRLNRGETTAATAGQIIYNLVKTMRKYNVCDLWAYNVEYDFTAIRNMVREYFDRMTEDEKKCAKWAYNRINPCDIWRYAAETLCNFKYCKWCEKHEFFTPSGAIATGAEIVYRYLTDAPDFVEEHRGIDDVRIECQILAACIATKKKRIAEPKKFLYKTVNAKRVHGNKGKKRK